jgi:hypothetical protein
MEKTYKIVRYYKDESRGPRVMRKYLTLKQAQEHCSDESTHKVLKDGTVVWFDGYTEM